MEKRTDIEGLRAIAVSSVLLFHYDRSWLPGGFVGVDVFFVISGYLITKRLEESIARNNGRLLPVLFDFYGRRIRRIYPALLAVLATTLAVGWFFLIPDDYALTGESAAYAAVGAGNLFYYWNTGYFDRSAELQLLLHTWSLGAEEQFYLVWPFLLFTLLTGVKSRGWVAVAISALIVVGLLYSARTVTVAPKSAFYLPFARAWELGAGALIAFLPTISNRWLSEVFGLAGAVLIGISLYLLHGTETSLGFWMVPVVLGSVLIIAPKTKTRVAEALSRRPFVAVGQISYSLYLWHWPIITFYRIANMEQQPSGLAVLVLLFLTFVVSIASYRYIEQPFRKLPIGRALATIPVAAAVVAAGLVIDSQSGVPWRLSPEATAMIASAKDYSGSRPKCHRDDDRNPPPEQSCVFGSPNVLPAIAVWSDSHGVELADALGQLGEAKNRSILSLTYSSCPPALGYVSPDQKKCREFNQSAVQFLVQNANIKTVVLTAFYEYYLSTPDRATFRTGLEDSISRLQASGKKIVVVASNPTPGYSLPHAASRLAMVKPNAVINLSVSDHRKTSGEARAMLDSIAARYKNVSIIDPADMLCGGSICQMIRDKRPILFDDNHLTLSGAKLVAGMIDLDKVDASQNQSGR
ncbi:MAG: acyltransferase family protein [Aquamicrobium sp.]|jgi:peptidoglycan/LPS O-acetylase OafA/YrhL|uniref:acyltransferase family protein n=1 Tax=Mesorhizobium sp. Pch-S TaxID=2082387 RepID=UPI001011EF59|nr:acyltransferase family protein [Mesorhizobium sp. Pch-S]MBR2692330.1 acyltransferase family protein [Aquamicrobium sp.]QAZ46301.1 hypothetical protein C1M53_28640 [Mesorhizobium sp. Pch-S]